ncbi:leucine-zipper-like transcriptional regulator 1 [Holotrichia oblita]|uniref:Leucine-zipper-like transcriptional regulator 1 n=1 Tax=Holotrichia oblita TaxID=644536 RepID=A0ACB9T815_HOLOL|nr:leucine-zipper-like transcriptional regulator 1 [Holotrichia oblita]
MIEPANFVSEFQSIKGCTLGEKQRNFNDFFKVSKAAINQDDWDIFIRSITPLTAAEELFKINLMIELERKELLLEQLKAGNRVLIIKLLRAWKIFRQLFSNVSSTDLVNNILPHLSYSLRLKVLNGISKNIINEEQLDKYFLEVKKKYGMGSAVIILPGCSVELIKSNIKKYHLKLPQSNLKRIIKKDKYFIDFYFDIMKQKYENMNFSDEYLNVLKYVARVDPNFYWKLEEKYDLNIRFGKYMTPKMMKSHKKLSDKGLQIFNRFNNLKIYKTIEKENNLCSFLVDLYPETHDKFIESILHSTVFHFIKKAPYLQQYKLISSSFSQKYNKDLLDYPDYFTEDLLKITPLPEREKILDHKVKENENLYYLYGTAFSLPKFKQHMQHGSRSKIRQEYVESMIKTCFVNRDKSTLSETLNYLINRYKNDINLLRSVYELCLDSAYVKDLNAEHWDYLAKIQKIFDITNKDSWRNYTFYQNYLKFLFDNNKSVDEIVKSIVQKNADGRMYDFDFVTTKKYQKMYCDKISSYIDAYKEHDEYKKLKVQFLNVVIRQLKKQELLEYKRFFNQLEGKEWNCRHILEKGIETNDDEIHDLFWQINDIKRNGILMWYARNRPDRLKQNAHKICDVIEEYRPATFLQALKQFIDEDLKEKLIMHALTVINKDDFNKMKVPIVLLSVFSSKEFFELISTALPPSDGKVDLETDTGKINMQRAFIDGLRYTREPLKAFPWLLKFCVGDYLKFALSSLYSLAYNTAEISLQQHLEGLSNTALSVKKHRLLLARHLFLYDDFYSLLKSWSDTEKNLSMRNIILTKTLEYLVENPSENLWILAKQNLKSFNPADRGIYDFLLKFKNIPLDHIPEYIEAVYKVVVASSDSKVNQKKYELIEAIPLGLINKLNLEFLKFLIKETVCSKTETNFYWKCVFHVDETKRSDLFAENFAKLKDFAEENKFDINQPVHIRDTVRQHQPHGTENEIAVHVAPWLRQAALCLAKEEGYIHIP